MSEPISFQAPELAPETRSDAGQNADPVKDKPKPGRRAKTQYKPFRWL